MARSEYHTRLEDHPVVGGPYELGQPRCATRNSSSAAARATTCTTASRFAPSRTSKKSASKSIEDLNTALLALKAGRSKQMELRAEQWASQTNGDDFYKPTRR